MNLSPFFKKEVPGLLLGGRETNPDRGELMSCFLPHELVWLEAFPCLSELKV